MSCSKHMGNNSISLNKFTSQFSLRQPLSEARPQQSDPTGWMTKCYRYFLLHAIRRAASNQFKNEPFGCTEQFGQLVLLSLAKAGIQVRKRCFQIHLSFRFIYWMCIDILNGIMQAVERHPFAFQLAKQLIIASKNKRKKTLRVSILTGSHSILWVQLIMWSCKCGKRIWDFDLYFLAVTVRFT